MITFNYRMFDTVRRIITGGPGFGKTSILTALNRSNRNTFDEVARLVIKQEMARNSDHLPWLDNLAFSHKVLSIQKTQFNEASGIAYYDRGAPDILAYLKHNNQVSFSELEDFLNSHSYDTKVFLTPPWQEIYQQDEERKESFEEACQIHDALVDTYAELGYDLIEIPKYTIKERLAFVLSHE